MGADASGSLAASSTLQPPDDLPVWPRRTSTAALLAILIALQAGVLFGATNGSFFIADDYYHFKLAEERSLLHYIATPIVHTYPAPGHRLLFFAFHSLFPMNYGAARILLLAFLAGTTILLGQFVRMLARSDAWWTAALLTPFGVSLAFVSVVDWWSAGVPVIPALFFTTVALQAWLRSYMPGRPVRWLAVAVLAMAAAGGFYLKFLLVPFYFLFLRLAIFPRILGLASGIRALWQERGRWMAVAAFPALFVVVYVASGLAGRSYVEGERPYLAYLATGWFEVFVPLALLNLPVQVTTPSSTAWLLVLSGQAVFWSAVWATWRRTALAVPAWLLLIFVFAINMVMVGSVRLPSYGVEIAYPLRYYPEIVLFLPVALALGLRQGQERSARAAWERTRTGGFALAAFSVLLACSFLLQAPAIGDASEGAQAGRWMDNLRHGVGVAAKRGVVRLVDSEVPDYVVPAWLTPLNRVSAILRLLKVDAVYNDPSGPLYVVRPDGRIVEAAFHPVSSPLVPKREVRGTGHGDAHSGPPCIRGQDTLIIPPVAQDGERLALRIVYADGSRGPVTLDAATSTDLVRTWVLHAERRAEIVDLGTLPLRRLALSGIETTALCLEQIQLGSLILDQRPLQR